MLHGENALCCDAHYAAGMATITNYGGAGPAAEFEVRRRTKQLVIAAKKTRPVALDLQRDAIHFQRRTSMQRIALFTLSCTAILLATESRSHASEGLSLMGMIAEWQYPDSTINGATMSDGETVNSQGERTRQSIKCKTVLTTADPMKKVIAYYKTKLNLAPEPAPADHKPNIASGRSVTFHDDSHGRPLAIQVIVVNTEKASTTLVISRGEKETETHIAWTHYVRL